MCFTLHNCNTRRINKFHQKNDRTAAAHAPSRIPKQRLNVKATPTPASDTPKPSLLPKPKVKVVIPPALQQQQRLRQQQQQQQSQPEEPAIQEEEEVEQEGGQPSTPSGSRIPVRTLKAERRVLAAAARQAGLGLDEYMRQLEQEQAEEEQQLQPSTPTTPTGKSRAMLK